MAKLKDGAFTGSKKNGNPYQGDLGKGIDYDKYEANFDIIKQDGNYPIISKTYRTGAMELIEYLKVEDGWTIADIGSGTAIATLELHVQNPGIKVVGFEISEGMLEVGRYKFHQSDGKKLLEQVKDKKILQYWHEFRNESKKFRDKVEFRLGDFQDIEIEPESIDGAIANQVMHWMDLPKAFKQINNMLKEGGEVVWNSASHFYNDSAFPAEDYGFRYNDFMKYVSESVKEIGLDLKDYRELSRPKHNLDSIKAVTSEQGLKTERIGTWLVPVDLQTFVKNHVPVFVKELVIDEIESDELKNITNEAIAEAINTPEALEDITHKYDIAPIFKSVKS